MVTKFKFLAVACLLVGASAINDSDEKKKKKIRVDPAAAKEIADAFTEALKEEEPAIEEERKMEKSLLNTGVPEVTKMATPLKGLEDILPHGDWATDFEKDVSDLVMGLTAAGAGAMATPFGDSIYKIVYLIEQEMMPKVIHAHNVNQESLKNLSEGAENCTGPLIDAVNISNQSFKLYLNKTEEHGECRKQEKSLHDQNVQCHSEWEAAKSSMKLKCAAYLEKQKEFGETTNNQAIVQKAPSEDIEVYIRRISATICGPPFNCSDLASMSRCSAASISSRYSSAIAFSSFIFFTY